MENFTQLKEYCLISVWKISKRKIKSIHHKVFKLLLIKEETWAEGSGKSKPSVEMSAKVEHLQTIIDIFEIVASY